MSFPVLEMIKRLLSRGATEATIAIDIDPLRLYVMMVALSQFHVSNVHTLSIIFEQDLSNAEWRAKRRADAREMLAAYLVHQNSSRISHSVEAHRGAKLSESSFARRTLRVI